MHTEGTTHNNRFIICSCLLTLGFLWLWTFNRNPHVLIKYFSHQGYIITWFYFVMAVAGVKKVLSYSLSNLYQLSLVLQMMITPAYWFVIHGPSVSSGRLSDSNIYWNMYIHTAPLLLLVWDYSARKPTLSNNWRHSMFFYFFFAVPVNVFYSLWKRPVYFFLKYQRFSDMMVILGGAILLFLLHQFVYVTFSRWKKASGKRQ